VTCAVLLLLLLLLLLLHYSGPGAGETVGTALLDSQGSTISVGHLGKKLPVEVNSSC
jgi:hypothetical protein